jgi:alanine dehydrogenase
LIQFMKETGLLVISEDQARRLVSAEDAIREVERSFASIARGSARNYPVVREAVNLNDAVFGVKSGCDTASGILGLKAGGYWPKNATSGVTNHQSSTLLFDTGTGRAVALVSANYLTGVRTGASSAIATKHLARTDANVLGMIGVGGQAPFQLRATMAVRDLSAVHAWDPSAENLARFGTTVEELGLSFHEGASVKAVAGEADILITATPSQGVLVENGWVRPGVHINAMGADTKGKQELDPLLVASAALFVDEAEQSRTIGEFQHAFAQGLVTAGTVRGSIGQVIEGMVEGRRTEDEVTIFDGTGVALQDLVVAKLAVRLAVEQGLVVAVDY